MTSLRRCITAIETGLDEVFSGRWWWRACRYVAERRLEWVLNQFGENSLAARRETERYRRMQFAVTFWRPAPSPVRQVVLRARQAGVSMSDLQLIVLNTDVRTRSNKAFVRRSVLARALSATMATVVGVHWFLMYVLAVTAPGPIWLKILVILGIFVVYATLYRGWSLYAYRALAAVDQSGKQLDQLCSQSNSGNSAKLHQLNKI
ncbi:hypothetical protein [Lysobacter solisilvae (ex Woo and Kim 2020)]|uniref:Uncharacterized protein n=1 Tax=Agrilutibacter terrestris TaxID=2865112 RepID=A0A7H0FZZ8_9GAMM|nr:hypothetical protein [Lysobacter terrestris]QNP41614.1 hypothetical protein H8B22_05250 [Lysobacter terrestris]